MVKKKVRQTKFQKYDECLFSSYSDRFSLISENLNILQNSIKYISFTKLLLIFR